VFFRGGSLIAFFEFFLCFLVPFCHLFGRFLASFFDVFSMCEKEGVPRRFLEVFWSLLPTEVYVIYKD
jgi:hypothetical protein